MECICYSDFFRTPRDNMCQNGGTCATTKNRAAFECICKGGYPGKHCEVKGIASTYYSFNHCQYQQYYR